MFFPKFIVVMLLAAAPAAPAHSAKLDPDEVKCRSDPEIGSLVKRKKICLKRSDWKKLRQDARKGIEDSQSHGSPIRFMDGGQDPTHPAPR